MTRTDDDSWDITESVGATPLGVAWARTQEATSDYPLFTDPHAEVFVEEAMKRGWKGPQIAMAERIRSISGYAAARTKWFDEFFIAASACGISQAVILAAGLDARAWRLPWNDGSVVDRLGGRRIAALSAGRWPKPALRTPSTNSARGAAGSPLRPSAPASSIRSTLPAAARGCA